MSRYIDADALIAKYGKKLMCNEITSEEYYAIKVPLDYIPTADVVEVVHGEWHPRTDLPKQEIFICSVCGGWAYSPWIGNRKKPKPNWCKYKYCPNCGADMRGGQK